MQNHPCYNPKRHRLTKPAIIRCYKQPFGVIDRVTTLRSFTRRVLKNFDNDVTLTPAQMETIMMVFTKDQLATFLNGEQHGNLNR